jgi:hypothetical protein
MSIILEDIPHKKWSVSYQSMTFEEYLHDLHVEEQIWLRPFSPSTVDFFFDKDFQRRMATETPLNHLMAIPQTLFVLRMSIGWEKSRSNVPLQLLSYYYSTFDSEPVQYNSRTPLFTQDSCYNQRVITLFNAAVNFETFVRPNFVSMPTFLETLLYHLDWPFKNPVTLKYCCNIARQSMFSNTRNGKIIRYSVSGEFPNVEFVDFIVDDIQPHENDNMYYKYMESRTNDQGVGAITESIRLIDGLGLRRLSSLASYLIGADFNYRSKMQAMWFMSIDGWTGYSGGFAAYAFKHQAEIDPDLASITNPPYQDYVHEEWYNLTVDAARMGKIMSFEDLWALALTSMTSRSAGEAALRKQDVYVKLRRTDVSGIRGLFVYRRGKFVSARGQRGEKWIKLNLTSKRDYMMLFGEDIFGTEELSRKYTHEDPGLIGERRVPVKANRAIYMAILSKYIAQMPVRHYVDFFQISVSEQYKNIGTSNDFTVGKEVGVVFLDHFPSFVGTTLYDILIDGADYTAFDSHQREENSRKYAREGIVDGLRATGLHDTPYGDQEKKLGFDTLEEWIEVMWGDGITRNAHFLAKTGDTKFDIVLDILQSGEYLTLNYNNCTNRALFKYFLDVYEKKYGIDSRFQLLKRLFQGDDALGFWRFPDDVKTQEDEIRALRHMIDLFVDTGRINGFDLNVLKTSVRRYRSEYLKKNVFYGAYMPLWLIQIFCSEKLNRDFPIQQIISYASTLNVAVGRGFPHILARSLLLFTWNFRRSLRADTRDESIMYYLPHGCLFLPKSLGGCGVHPNTIIGANMDMVIAHQAYSDEYLMNLISHAYYILDSPTISTREHLANSLVKDTGVYPRNPFGKGKLYANSVKQTKYSQKLKLAAESARHLIDSGLRGAIPKRLDIRMMDDIIVKSALLDNTSMRQLAPIEKVRKVHDYIERDRSGMVKSFDHKYNWLRNINFVRSGDVISANHGMVHWYLDEVAYNILDRFGLSRGDRLRFSPSQLLNILRNDSKFPRYINESDIMNILSDERLLVSPTALVDVLIIIGASPSNAQRVVESITTSTERFAIIEAASSLSLMDSFVSAIDMTRENLSKWVDVVTGDSVIDDLIRYLGMGYIIASGDISPIVCIMDDRAIMEIRSDIMGTSEYHNSEFIETVRYGE